MHRPLLSLLLCLQFHSFAFADSCRLEPIGKVLSTYSGDVEPANEAMLSPSSFVGDRQGNIYFIDTLNIRVRMLSPDGIIHNVTGNGVRGSAGDGGPAVAAELSPTSIAVTPDGIVYIADSYDRIRRVDREGIITTVAGTGIRAFNGESGPALSMHLSGPTGLFADTNGDIYFADRFNARIRKLTPNGMLFTIAGST